jgi:hypothetical protein
MSDFICCVTCSIWNRPHFSIPHFVHQIVQHVQSSFDRDVQKEGRLWTTASEQPKASAISPSTSPLNFMAALISKAIGRPHFFAANANAYLTAGTSSSSLKIGGSGPTGVMLNWLIYFSLAYLYQVTTGNIPEYGS